MVSGKEVLIMVDIKREPKPPVLSRKYWFGLQRNGILAVISIWSIIAFLAFAPEKVLLILVLAIGVITISVITYLFAIGF